MEAVKVFIVENWQYISIALVIILDIVLLIVKRNKTNIIDNGLFKKVIDLTILAENKFGAGHGEDKLNFVLSSLSTEGVPEGMLKSIIEYVLSAPKRKEKQ